MKKLMLILVVAMVAAPAMATITFTAHDDGDGLLRIAYSTDGSDAPRGVALEVNIGVATVDENSTVSVDPAYNCYIDYAWNLEKPGGGGGYAVGLGQPLSLPDQAGPVTGEASTFVISMGVLDEGGNQNPGPGSTTNLITLQLGGGPATVDVTITGDTTRGPDSGVVGSVIASNLSDGGSVVLTGMVVPSLECYTGQPDYAEWEAAGKPDCWCYPTQCYGDADGKTEGSPFTGYYYVGVLDLNVLLDAWKIPEPPKGAGIVGILASDGINFLACADFAHNTEGSPFTGYYRVGVLDLNLLLTSWKIPEPPKGAGIAKDCPPGNVTP